MSLNRAVLGRELIVAVGSGGVGKTTTAATIGLWAATQGKKVLVLTIDPAKRLANSLGLNAFGNEIAQILLPKGTPGELHALMLDTQSTFDNLVGQLAPNIETRDRILRNPIYRTLSDTFAGSQEYMATEKLHDVVTSGRFDMVVLDTPPVKNALDFLEAPGRLTRFFDKKVLKWFLTPYDEKKVFGALMMGTSAVIFRLLSYIFGKEFLEDLSEFFLLWQDMTEEFKRRHDRVQAMLREGSTRFVTVCAPTEPSVEVASFFAIELRKRGLPRAGVVVNQVHPGGLSELSPKEVLGAMAAERAADLAGGTDRTLLARLALTHTRYRELVAAERARIDEIRRLLGDHDGFLIEVPRLEEEVNDLDGLARLGDHLFGPR